MTWTVCTESININHKSSGEGKTPSHSLDVWEKRTKMPPSKNRLEKLLKFNKWLNIVNVFKSEHSHKRFWQCPIFYGQYRQAAVLHTFMLNSVNLPSSNFTLNRIILDLQAMTQLWEYVFMDTLVGDLTSYHRSRFLIKRISLDSTLSHYFNIQHEISQYKNDIHALGFRSLQSSQYISVLYEELIKKFQTYYCWWSRTLSAHTVKQMK